MRLVVHQFSAINRSMPVYRRQNKATSLVVRIDIRQDRPVYIGLLVWRMTYLTSSKYVLCINSPILIQRIFTENPSSAYYLFTHLARQLSAFFVDMMISLFVQGQKVQKVYDLSSCSSCSCSFFFFFFFLFFRLLLNWRFFYWCIYSHVYEPGMKRTTVGLFLASARR